MTLISVNDNIPCPYCENLRTVENYAFGADFPAVANNDSFYIRKSIRNNRFELVYEGEGIDSSCRIEHCPICGRKLM